MAHTGSCRKYGARADALQVMQVVLTQGMACHKDGWAWVAEGQQVT